MYSETESISFVLKSGFETLPVITASFEVVLKGTVTTVPVCKKAEEQYVNLGADERVNATS
jgi:hypothetical protein